MRKKTLFYINKKAINCFIMLVCFLSILSLPAQARHFTFAQNLLEENYIVFDEEGGFLFERVGVQIDDIYIDKNFNKYQVYLVDQLNKTAKAKFVEQLKRPSITKKSREKIEAPANKAIGLYLTHNAESYLIGDGTDSIYGKGGIHDIAKQLARDFQQKGVKTTLSETLHLPHDSMAYARSRGTASKLLQEGKDAIFDIHRDGVNRHIYARVTDGKEHSTVRIVIGQANPNHTKNLDFAMWLLAVAEITHPWLFLDIYLAKGHYNQGLTEKSLLFEMGTYTIEKNLVLQTTKPLADVIYTTLYTTTVDESGNLAIGGKASANSKTINEALSGRTEKNHARFTSAAAVIIFVGLSFFLLFKWRQKIKQG